MREEGSAASSVPQRRGKAAGAGVGRRRAARERRPEQKFVPPATKLMLLPSNCGDDAGRVSSSAAAEGNVRLPSACHVPSTLTQVSAESSRPISRRRRACWRASQGCAVRDGSIAAHSTEH